MLGLAGELRAELRVLRRDTRRAGVEVADAHHDAAGGNQRRGGEAEFLGAKQRGNDDVAAGLELAVGLDGDAAAEIVEHERLVRLGQAEFPRQARVLQRGVRRRAGAAVVAGDEDDIGVRLGDAGGDGADADLGHELHAHTGVAVAVLQVVNQLREVLDGVDVVVRRRGDQADARGRAAGLGNPRVNLGTGQLAALAGLRALGHLDLEFLRAGQVLARHAETAGGDLLDRGILGVAVRHRRKAVGVLAALAGVGLAADAVHRDGERLMRLLRDGAVGHRAGLEAQHDLFRRLDLLDRDRRGRLEFEQAAQCAEVFALFVDQLGEILEGRVAAGARRALEVVDGFRREQVILALRAPLVDAADGQHVAVDRAVGIRGAVPREDLLGDDVEADAADA